MREIFTSLLAGFLAGLLFSWIRLPIPAPDTLAGILGILGIYLGYFLFQYLKKF